MEAQENYLEMSADELARRADGGDALAAYQLGKRLYKKCYAWHRKCDGSYGWGDEDMGLLGVDETLFSIMAREASRAFCTVSILNAF